MQALCVIVAVLSFHSLAVLGGEVTIAVVGAGIGSASTVHYIADYFDRTKSNISINIDIFEQNGWIGGRENETWISIDDSGIKKDYFVETGATIMIYGNKMVYNFSKLLNLTIVDGGMYGNLTNNYNLGFYNFKQNKFKFITNANISSLNRVTFQDLKRNTELIKHFGIENLLKLES